MDDDSSPAAAAGNLHNGAVLPEVEAYSYLLVVLYLVDADKMEQVGGSGCETQQ